MKSERQERRIKNSLASGSFVVCSLGDLKLLNRLVVQTGNASEGSISDI